MQHVSSRRAGIRFTPSASQPALQRLLSVERNPTCKWSVTHKPLFVRRARLALVLDVASRWESACFLERRRWLMSNYLVGSMPDADRREFLSHGQSWVADVGQVVELPGDPVSYAHFPERGYLSILLTVGGRRWELGVVGREGMLGLPASMGTDIRAYGAIARERVEGIRLPVPKLREMMAERPALRRILVGFLQAGTAQITYTAFANAKLTIPQRLARWLLMLHDRSGSDDIVVTHRVLGEALSVRRAGITTALHLLEAAKSIRSTPRAIVIRDRSILVEMSAGSYGPAERAYKALIGQSFGSGQSRS